MSRWIYVTLLPVINSTYREFFNFIQIREKMFELLNCRSINANICTFS